MANLVEFNTIIILRDTPETRWAFGPPIDENEIKNSNVNVNDVSFNPFFKRLYYGGLFQEGWRSGYPYLDGALQVGVPPQNGPGSDGTGLNTWVNAVRNNILNAVGMEENSSQGFNLTPASSGKAIIYQNKLYLGGTQQINYTNITVGADVEVTRSGSGTIATGTKVRLSSTAGLTGLDTEDVYYVYGATSTTFKLSLSNGTTPITSASGTYAGGTSKATLVPNGHIYTEYTGFSTSPALNEGDHIFWGDDANDLNVGGRIKTVYTSGDPEYADGARYEFYKNTIKAFPVNNGGDYDGDPIPQNIYYYRSNWNGKGIKNNTQISPNEIGGGFYVLIKGLTNSFYQSDVTYPYLGFDAARNGDLTNNNPNDRIVETGTLYAFTDLVRVRRISNKWANDENDNGVSEEIIPCTIHRTNNFYYSDAVDRNPSNTGNLVSLHGNGVAGGFSEWIAYYVNPYGGNVGKLEKNTTYVVEINERLPSASVNNGGALFAFAKGGGM